MAEVFALSMGLMTLLVLLGVGVAFVILVVRGIGRTMTAERLAVAERDIKQLGRAYAELAQRAAKLEAAMAHGEAEAVPVPDLASDPVPVPVPDLVSVPVPVPVPVPDSVSDPVPVPVPVPDPAPDPTAAAPPPPVPPPSPPSPPSPPPPPPDDSSARIERWLGVRGAAALGAAVLVLAGIYFLKFSIDHGWLSPAVRASLAALAGVGCVTASELWLRKRYTALANWLGGAGCALLYLAIWAASARYGIVPIAVAFPLMACVTAACATLALYRRAIPIAILGLLGGFATPFLLSTGEHRPLALFGYLLVLDVGLLFVAQRLRWTALTAASLVGTLVYQLLFFAVDMRPSELWLGLSILATFSLLFALVPEPKTEHRSPLLGITRAAAILSPFLFGLYLAIRSDLGPHLFPTGGLLLLVTAGAMIAARVRGGTLLPLAATASSIGVLAAWLLVRPLVFDTAIEAQLFALGLALLCHLPTERLLARRGTAPGGLIEHALAVSVATLGGISLTALAAARSPGVPPWIWLSSWTLLAALAVRHGTFGGERTPLAALGPLFLGIATSLLLVTRSSDAGFPSHALLVGIAIATSIAVSALAVRRVSEPTRTALDAGAALHALIVSLHFVVLPKLSSLPVPLVHGAVLTLGLVAALAAARRGAGLVHLAAALVTALVLSVHVFGGAGTAGGAVWVPWASLTVTIVAAAFFAIFPLVAPRLATSPWAHRAGAIGLAVLCPAAWRAFHTISPEHGDGLVPLVFALLAIGAAFLARARLAHDPVSRRVAIVWLATAATAFVTLAVPLELEREWITIAWALEGALVLALWQRLDHPGLKYLGLTLLAGVTVRLVANPWLLEYHLRSELPGLVWLSYTFLVPTVCLLFARSVLARYEQDRLRPFERAFAPPSLELLPRALALAAIAVVFVYLNLVIFDAFADGDLIAIPVERLPSRDLTTSLVWALYGLSLFGIGVNRTSRGLRAVALALVALTSAKVFLYDLAHLQDLYRVASLAGLAFCLLAISLAYQRFVFRSREPDDPDPPTPAPEAA